MECERLNRCPFFAKFKNELGPQQFQLLIKSYCKGILMETCKRLAYEKHNGEPAPANLCPSGFQYKDNCH
jgi:hypothetical protein